MVEAAYRAGAKRYFFFSSACAYNTTLQQDPHVRALKESDAYPAMAERGYGWEKLMSEMFCQEYWAERKFETYIARFPNVYGPHGTWDGGREKAPAAICRKVIEAKESPEVCKAFADATTHIPLRYEAHEDLKQRVPGAIGLIRTGDTIQYANMVLVSGQTLRTSASN